MNKKAVYFELDDFDYINIESYDTLYDPNIILDKNGNCYTLSESDFDDVTQVFNFSTDNFFKNTDISN